MGKLTTGVSALVLALTAHVNVADACGGFFCGQVPVDQTAERIVFRVNEDTTTMIVQIAYAGAAPDFAWVLPVGTVPDVESLDTFPQRALTALDANTGPVFQRPDECIQYALDGCPTCGGPQPSRAAPEVMQKDVTVHFRAEVGPYDVAAVESDDPTALFDWLRDNAFNVNDAMLPYIEAYTNENMKFVALKLQHDADSSDIQPFRFDLPGTSPSVPLRMTALAAEPEMSIAVFVFGDGRYNGANWPEVQIGDDQIVWRDTWPMQTNWAALVAKGVDTAGGQGWVTEFAGPTADMVDLLQNSRFNTPEDEQAGMALLDLVGSAPYMSRLYTRVSAEEMASDPIFRRDMGGDVAREHLLSRIVNGVDLCPDVPTSEDPCLFTSCGAGGICRPVQLTGMDAPVAGCGCLAGATARTTFDPASVSLRADGAVGATVVCQDARMSFLNPGDAAAEGGSMEDPCNTFDCGPNGACLVVNMTPTCVCDEGFVAIGSFSASGARTTRCEQPMAEVPEAFYAQRLPDLADDLPGGREMAMVDMSLPVVQPSMEDLGSGATNAPKGQDSGLACNIARPGTGGAPPIALVLLGAVALGLARRRMQP